MRVSDMFCKGSAAFIATHRREHKPPALCGKMWQPIAGHPCGGRLEEVEIAIEFIDVVNSHAGNMSEEPK